MKSPINTSWVIGIVLLVGATLGFSQDRPSTTPLPGTSFESMAAGSLRRASDPSGMWTADAGHAEITRAHHRSGQQSLHLIGGSMREILWTPGPISGGVDRLDLWFERWTSRPPFDFVIEEKVGDTWKTLYHDKGKAEVGTFRHHLSLPLQGNLPQQIRFRSTSPPGSGVLIDDVSLVRNAPMVVKNVSVDYPIVPVLTGSRYNAVAEVTIETEGNLEPLSLQQIELQLGGTIAADQIESMEIFSLTGSAPPTWNRPESVATGLQAFADPLQASGELRFTGTLPLQPGANSVYASLKLKQYADPSHTVMLECKAIQVAGKSYEASPERSPTPLRIGCAIRQSQDDDVHTFRIPGLVTTNNGTLIAVYDIRRSNGGDLPGNIDVGMSRSTDGGKSWEPMQVILDMGENPKWRYDGVGDPAVLVDRNTGTIWVAGLWSHGNRAWHGSGPGLTPDETGQIVLSRSDDDGKTWSTPINITSQVKRKEWCLLLQGPGKGITMQDGTLVFAAQFQDATRLPHSAIIYSQDHGKTWQSSTAAWPDTTEAQVIEIAPGVLMLNCRYNRAGVRVVMTTTDMGKTWQEHSSSQKLLIEPGACMASLINVASETTGSPGPLMLFSNPNSRTTREHITIKGSTDSGASWPQEFRVLLDEGRGAGYSCMTMIDDHTVGILYEGSRSLLTFQRIPLPEIVPPKRPANVIHGD
ncbi:exo-alpha-sialidase [Bremerella cremea]|uniref:exo-alpha-sialidase n=1 Tax=Bremerella cremea TaxID=1031537 RepID=UPI0031EFD58A